jgi:hypothetical protein
MARPTLADRGAQLQNVIDNLTTKIAAEPTNTDLPPLLATAQAELAALEAQEASAEAAAPAATTTAASETTEPAATTAAPAATEPAATTAAPAATTAAPTPPARPTPPRRTPPQLARPSTAAIQPVSTTLQRRAPRTLVSGNVSATGELPSDHPSRLRPGSRPTPQGA